VPGTPPKDGQNAAAVRRVVWIILLLNLLVAAGKGVYAWYSHSLAVATDAIHSTLDCTSNIVGLIALRAAMSPPDREHPYGHAKVEIVAAAVIGVFIGGASFKFAWSAIDALAHGVHGAKPNALGFVVMGGTLVANLFVAIYEHRRGKALGSAFLVADALHTASDVVVTVGVIASLAVTAAGFGWADPVAALLVTAVIARVAWRVLASNVDILLDRAVLDAERVREQVLAVTGVRGAHRVRSRGLEGAYHVDLHLTVDPDLSVAAAHDITHAVETRLRGAFAGLVDVTIHVEPDGDEEEGL
jgi:cation diffusion facilitator family transporter